jgi:Ca-activated chloride channel homolog
MINEITFLYTHFLWLLAVIPLLTAWYIFKNHDRTSDLRFSHSGFLAGVSKSFRQRMIHLPFILRMIALALLIIALARPQTSSRGQNVNVEGIDIMIALDISGSMLAEDFRPNRMESAKTTAINFIDLRPGDRIGMTVFSGQSFTLCPLTTDHVLLKDLVSKAGPGMVEDGTAIGDGLATAINRLRESQTLSKVIILLTDGINNAGVIDPRTAAQIAGMYDIRVYTIGVGSSGPVPYPFQTPLGIRYQNVEIPVDEELLKEIAYLTGGKFFWADSPGKLEAIYQEINQMERTRIDVMEFTRMHDEFLALVLLALVFVSFETIIRNTWLRTIP